MDVVLADAVSGIEAADAIQEETEVPVLFLTAIDYRPPVTPGNKRRLVLGKPYNPDDLRAALVSLLGEPPNA